MEITIKNLDHTYMPGTPFEHEALKGINLHIESGKFVAIIGHTGSGKSTIVQHLNGLLKPTSGSIQIGEYLIEANKKNKDISKLRKHVGVVFQYPEHQLFDETVESDIAFGPLNFGLSKEQVQKRVAEVIPLVNLSEDVLKKSPFDLSGGQKRRVAIAGVLASKPHVLVLDEPTAGLDPLGRTQMMELFVTLHKAEKLTTILVTHNMEFAAMYADVVVVMDKGKILLQGSPEEIFNSKDLLKQIGLDVPQTVQMAMMLEERFDIKLPKHLFTNEKLVEAIVKLLEKGGE
ncbi:energy-coupling factor transporter ATPase [Anaerobacillus alkalidiazotrophicus]|uniref:Energy-coupling factor transporter ATP-binding protein EcfA2 n=1 Tax=Anaerobacillus alkalidiazotrophicus TaxID=472963 RepID=A0A1S2MAB4_9BACI|nr:energy-coupling factor ABC transporter ATP-binding protein [Anaerobacillus alkalidiazotrophicus]OIJ21648.1 energy-coupling factor transporter ATPase [Anaerobacillus alkalidiazotrophicus]